MEMVSGFGRRLKDLRERVHPTMTKSDISRMIGISKSQMSSYEARDTAHRVEVQAIASLAKAYNTSMEYICFGKEATASLSLDDLKYALVTAQDIIPSGDVEQRAKLVDFIYNLKSKGAEPTPEILQAFYQSM